MENSQLSKHWKEYQDYKYLGAYSFEALEKKEITLTISKVVEESVKGEDGKAKPCIVAHFKENQKPMILNKTNCKVISQLAKTGIPIKWVGLRIIVYPRKVDAWGKKVDALRVRDYLPKSDIDATEAIKKLNSCKFLEDLQTVYMDLSSEEKTATIKLKDELKTKLPRKNDNS